MDRLPIEIADRGPGLPAALRDHIGQPLVITTKPVGEAMGLGLYLARTTRNRLGGQVDRIERQLSGIAARIAPALATLLAAGPE